ncbi:hypothetical protein CL648_04360, partial [bacterium]|nr:hypothetical protein [bacterium]
MTLYANSPVSKPELDPQAIDWAPVQSLATVPTLGGQTIADTSRIQPASTVVDARPSVPQDPDYFEAIVSGRAFILDDPVLRDWLDNPEIRQTATVVYGLNPQGERVDGLGLTLDTGQTVLIHREDLGHVHSGQLAAASSITPLFKQGSTGDRIQTPEGRLNSAWSQRAGVAYLPDVIDPDSAAVVAIVAELRSHGRLRPGMTEEEVFAVVQAEMARRYQYQSDGDRDAWQSVQQTLQRGRGDCEDWSIATASVLARALHGTGHSPDGVQLYIIADGDQAHMVVAYAGLVWDSKQPDSLNQSSVSSVVIITQSKLRVVDDTAVDWLLAVGTASGTASGSAGKIGQQISVDARNDRSGLPISFNELASITTNDLYALMHGDSALMHGDSALVDIGNALANGEITQQQLKDFLAMQRKFDAMRALFVVLMHVVQQRGKWIRLILAMIEGVEESKDPSDHKYSFEGINFNQLTQSILAVFVADIESELA